MEKTRGDLALDDGNQEIWKLKLYKDTLVSRYLQGLLTGSHFPALLTTPLLKYMAHY